MTDSRRPIAAPDARMLAEWLWLREQIAPATTDIPAPEASPSAAPAPPPPSTAPTPQPPAAISMRPATTPAPSLAGGGRSSRAPKDDFTPGPSANPQLFPRSRPPLWSELDVSALAPEPSPSLLLWKRALAQCSPRTLTASADLDIRAICQDFAASGVWFEHYQEHLERRMRLLVIVDQALQMRPFRNQILRLVSAARTPGLFADVDVLGGDLRGQADWELRPLGHFGPDRARQRPLEHSEVSRHPQPVVCLLVTDALGDALIDGTLARFLRSFPPGSRSALVHPWPPYAWQRSRVGRLTPVAAGSAVAVPESVLPIVALSPEGITSLEPWVRASSLGDLYAVHLPSKTEAAAIVNIVNNRRELRLPWDQRAHLLSRFLEPAAIEALIAAALVPGNVDMRLLRLLSAAVGSHGGVSAHGLSLALAAGFLRLLPGQDTSGADEPVFGFAEDAAREALLQQAPPSVLRDTLRALAHALVADGSAEAKEQARRLQIPTATLAWLSNEPALKPRPVELQREARLPGRAVLDRLLAKFWPERLAELPEAAPQSEPGDDIDVVATRPRRRTRSPKDSMTAPLARILQPAFKALEKDLLDRARLPTVEAGLQAAWNKEREAGETGQGFDPWRRARVTQLAAAWVLSVVFVRTLEDRRLIEPRIAGPDAESLAAARDREAAFVQLAPFLGPREYLLAVFRELSHLPGAREVFDVRHNPIWVLAPSSEGARTLLDFVQKQDAQTGAPILTFEGTDTRYLGDLYQDLSEAVRKRYALLQTPDFVEKFILEQTLHPAIREFGLAEVRLIDPTCGSGHFLLGAFHDLLEAWQRYEPGTPIQELARRALGQVYGVDINPYAVAIARFRLVLAVLDAVGIKRLDKAPALRPKVVVADSLLHRMQAQQRLSQQLTMDAWESWGDGLFRLAEPGAVEEVLAQRYHAVVGNPPYITEKDATKRKNYRDMYKSAAGAFALAAPFTERFFELAVHSGFVGLINSNAWTKQKYGKTLIEKVLSGLDIQKIVDTSGCYLPGHGTPTLLLFGRNRRPSGDEVIAVLGKRGEQEVPPNPAHAPVWSAILKQHNSIGSESSSISVEVFSRAVVGSHPWVLAGGGVLALKRVIDAAGVCQLSSLAADMGFGAVTRDDAVFVVGAAALRRGIPRQYVQPFITGKDLRDWSIEGAELCIWPYEAATLQAASEQRIERALWPWKHRLMVRVAYGKTQLQRGLRWSEYSMYFAHRFRTPLTISFAFVSTHNNFILDRKHKVFNRHAPIIKLGSHHTEADHQALLGYLNSSTVGFWCRLVMFPKGGDQVGDGARLSATQWNRYLEYAGNLLQQLPVPDLDRLRDTLLDLVVAAEDTVRQIANLAPDKTVAATLAATPTLEALREARTRTLAERARLRGILISLQEEMDWRVYGLFGLPTVTAPSVEAVRVPVEPNHRPFEVRLARDVASDISASEWFRVHKREPPADVGGPLAELYRQRLRLLDHPEHGRQVRLLETPETKRRWSPPDDARAFRDAVRTWLLERIEAAFRDQPTPELRTARQLSLDLRRDPAVQAAHELLTEDTGLDLVSLLSELVDAEGVPFLAGWRYTETGMEKRATGKNATWEETWRLQRLEDQGTLEPELERLGLKTIPVPDKYAPKDFQRHYWGLRGKLDVPKERFITVPGGNNDDDPTTLVGWAGWDHLQAAQALAALYQRRKTDDGWTGSRLVPLLAGIAERVPWLLQWHDQPSDAYGGMKLGQFFRDFVAGEAHVLGVAVDFTQATDDLRSWTPPAAPKRKSLDPDEVYAALVQWTPDIDEDEEEDEATEPPEGPTAKELASEVGASQALVDKALKKLVADGRVEKLNGRPARYVAIGGES